MLSGVIAEFPWQKSMRWGAGSMRWVRPLQRILCLFGGQTLGVKTRNDVPCGNETSGHRFLAPEPFAVQDFADYRKTRAAHVILDREERKSLILDGAQRRLLHKG